LYYSLRCFMMDLWDHAQGECAASSDAELQTQLELTSLQVCGRSVSGRSGLTQQKCILQYSRNDSSNIAAAWGRWKEEQRALLPALQDVLQHRSLQRCGCQLDQAVNG
jgi:hypothetical protein